LRGKTKVEGISGGLGPAKLPVPLVEYFSTEERVPFVLSIIHVIYVFFIKKEQKILDPYLTS
ncbi:hypothetical protein ED312_08975, partial [Sinomicrobium pectinilyticum]